MMNFSMETMADRNKSPAQKLLSRYVDTYGYIDYVYENLPRRYCPVSTERKEILKRGLEKSFFEILRNLISLETKDLCKWKQESWDNDIQLHSMPNAWQEADNENEEKTMADNPPLE